MSCAFIKSIKLRWLRSQAINERQLSHPGLDNPVWDQAVTSGWRAAPAQPILRCSAADAVRPQSVAEKTSLAPPQLHMRFTENNTTADPRDEVSALNCDFCCFLLWTIWLEVRREKGSAQQHRVGGRKNDASLGQIGRDGDCFQTMVTLKPLCRVRRRLVFMVKWQFPWMDVPVCLLTW